jgi:hypothetical protein
MPRSDCNNGTPHQCSTCCEVKAATDFPQRYGRRFGAVCKQCDSRRSRDYYERNRLERVAAASARYRSDPQRHNVAIVEWQAKNANKVLEYKRRSNKKAIRVAIDGLSDSYVRGLLAQEIGIPRAAVPTSLITFHRTYLRVKRHIKEKRNGSTSQH